MSFIGQVTFINQNMHLSSIHAADTVAREQFKNELQKQIEKEKEDKVREVRKIEESKSVDEDIAYKEERKKENKISKYHIDIKG